MILPKPKNYNELFRMTGRLTLLHGEFFVKGSLSLGKALVVCNDDVWSSFIDKKGEKKCLKAGLDIFGSPQRYKAYAGGFRDYIKNVAKPIIAKYKNIPKNISEPELKILFRQIQKFFYFYGITEFSFHDLAYEVMLKDKNKILRKNLNDLGKLKFSGREILNAYIFRDGVLHNILASISKKYLSAGEADFLLTEEIMDLYSGKRPSKKEIENRKRYYALTTNRNRLEEFSFSEAKKLFAGFTKIDRSSVISGVVTNKGIARGRVVIAPMLNDRKVIKGIVAKMKKGDVLVAQSTTPEYMALCRLASAIVTDQGGMLSHAAIVSRELNIPCIVGTKVATRILKDGDLVEVDADKGVVKIIKRK